MERNQSVGPDDAPDLGDEVDVEAAGSTDTGTESAAGDPEQAREDPLGGTGGISSGGAG